MAIVKIYFYACSIPGFLFSMDFIKNKLYPIFLQHPIVCTDSRNPVAGSIFFALSGPSFNGNSFAEKALEEGCAYAVIDDPAFRKDERYLVADDSLVALQQLANHHRLQQNAIVLGVTGSNGKTTTKELLHAVLKRKFNTVATIGNLNNQIGVPLTLLRITKETQLAIIEMGASKPGDIKELMEIAEPDYGLITNIGKAHLEGMGGYEGVIKTKTELYDWLRTNHKMVFVNTIHNVFIEKAAGLKQLTFGATPENDIRGEFLGADPFVHFRWGTKDLTIQSPVIKTQLLGFYNYENLLAAVAAGHYFGLSEKEINDAVSSYVPVNNRSQIIDSENNRIILDAYNANPTSMEAAITNFSEMKAGKKVVVLGKMMELGPTSAAEHKRIADLALCAGFEKVFLVGSLYEDSGVTDATRIFKDVNEAITFFKDHPVKDATVMIKGSRANQLELLRDAF